MISLILSFYDYFVKNRFKMLKLYILNVIFSVKHFNLFSCSILPQVLESFSARGQIGHVLVFEGHIISVAATQLCY